MFRGMYFFFLGTLLFASQSATVTAADASTLQIFERRILPILNAQRPSSCTECHLSGVELKDYLFPDQDKTFTSLVAAGLIDKQQPEKSKLLSFIERSPAKPNLITDKVRQEEAAAFRAWIGAAVKDPQLLKSKTTAASVGSGLPDEVIRHARQDHVLASFIDNVWSEVGRCAACHSPEKNQQQVKKFGERVSWIKPRDPQATLKHLLDSGIIDTDAPDKSTLLTKPTMQVEHGGGQKAMVGDRTYKQFRRFVDDYAAVVNGTYRKASDLPRDSDEVSAVSDLWLKIEGVPKEFDKLLLRADVYSLDRNGKPSVRVATGDRAVYGGGQLWQQHMTLLAPRGSAKGKEFAQGQGLALPRGRYLVRISIDRQGKLAKDPSSELGSADVIGEVGADAAWKPGYGSMTVIRFPQR